MADDCAESVRRFDRFIVWEPSPIGAVLTGGAPNGARRKENPTMAQKARRAQATGSNNFEPGPNQIECEVLEPIRTVVRELTSPDGTVLRVPVPVYPPFRLRDKSVPVRRQRGG